ncbi:MAG TPA: hypothetical protein VFT50_17185 [Baekduia sp.]|nr:hypothetical protein [Baekduia sp.]
MSLRNITALAAAAAALALPAAASAMPDSSVYSGTAASFEPVPAQGSEAPSASTTSDDGGISTGAVIAIAGGTLLLGAAGGMGGEWMRAHRHAVNHA